MAKYLDSNGLSHLIGKIKTALAGKMDAVTLATVATTGDYDDLTDKPTIPAPGTGSSYPTMDGTRALGSNAGFARVDHVHPSDTSRVPTTRKVNGMALSADVTITPAEIASPVPGQNLGTFLTNLSTTAGRSLFGKVKVGTTTIEADAATDTLELVAGSNVTLTPDATNDKVTIAATDTTYSDYDGSVHGLVPVADDQYSVLAGGGEWWGVPELMAAHMAAYPALYSAGFVKYDGADITTGALAESDIPALAASKITSGTFDAARIPSLAASKIGSGTLAAARLPDATTSAKGAVTKDSSISTGSSSTNVPTSAAVAAFVAAQMGDVAGALVYKGTVSAASGMANFKKGWYWIASGSFTIGSGSTAENVEAGDMLIANADGTSATASNIDVIQTNIETLTTTEIDTIWAAA